MSIRNHGLTNTKLPHKIEIGTVMTPPIQKHILLHNDSSSFNVGAYIRSRNNQDSRPE